MVGCSFTATILLPTFLVAIIEACLPPSLPSPSIFMYSSSLRMWDFRIIRRTLIGGGEERNKRVCGFPNVYWMIKMGEFSGRRRKKLGSFYYTGKENLVGLKLVSSYYSHRERSIRAVFQSTSAAAADSTEFQTHCGQFNCMQSLHFSFLLLALGRRQQNAYRRHVKKT